MCNSRCTVLSPVAKPRLRGPATRSRQRWRPPIQSGKPCLDDSNHVPSPPSFDPPIGPHGRLPSSPGAPTSGVGCDRPTASGDVGLKHVFTVELPCSATLVGRRRVLARTQLRPISPGLAGWGWARNDAKLARNEAANAHRTGLAGTRMRVDQQGYCNGRALWSHRFPSASGLRKRTGLPQGSDVDARGICLVRRKNDGPPWEGGK